MKRGVLAPACGLKKLRGELRLTQKEVPDKTRITEPAYRAYERGGGNPKPEILSGIAKALGVGLEYLSAPTSRSCLQVRIRDLGERGIFRLHCARQRWRSRYYEGLRVRNGLRC